MSTGWDKRLAILRQQAESKLLEPLRTHGWTVAIESAVEDGEFLIIKAERGGHSHRVAILYSSATNNAVYKALARQVEHIFIKGELSKLEAHAYGIDTPVTSADDFQSLLVQWNDASSEGKFAPEMPLGEHAARPPKHRTLLSETPIEAIWLRLRQLSSVTLARKLVSARAREAGAVFDPDALDSKAQGLAFALRNATDYFQLRSSRNVSQRVLNLYYGSLSFAFAEMLASPSGPSTLAEMGASLKLTAIVAALS